MMAAVLNRSALYQALGGSLVVGLVRWILFAWLAVRLSGWMRARGLRLQV